MQYPCQGKCIALAACGQANVASTTDIQQLCLIASPVDDPLRDVSQNASLNVDKVEASSHVGGHAFCEFVQFNNS